MQSPGFRQLPRTRALRRTERVRCSGKEFHLACARSQSSTNPNQEPVACLWRGLSMSPVIQLCQVFGVRRPIISSGFGYFYLVNIGIELSPARLSPVFLGWLRYKFEKPSFASAERLEIVLTLYQRDFVRSGCRRKTQLRKIIFPEADRANFIVAWAILQGYVPAARAGIFRHFTFILHRSVHHYAVKGDLDERPKFRCS